jgi:hypothetical protein
LIPYFIVSFRKKAFHMKIIILTLLFLFSLQSCDNSQSARNQASKLSQATELAAARLDSPSREVQKPNEEITRFLKKHKVSEAKVPAIKKLVQDRLMTSAVREIQGETKLPLPRAKALVDTLFHLVHGDPIN